MVKTWPAAAVLLPAKRKKQNSRTRGFLIAVSGIDTADS